MGYADRKVSTHVPGTYKSVDQHLAINNAIQSGIKDAGLTPHGRTDVDINHSQKIIIALAKAGYKIVREK